MYCHLESRSRGKKKNDFWEEVEVLGFADQYLQVMQKNWRCHGEFFLSQLPEGLRGAKSQVFFEHQPTSCPIF